MLHHYIGKIKIKKKCCVKREDCLHFKNHDYKTIILPNNNIKFVVLFFPIIKNYILGIFSF